MKLIGTGLNKDFLYKNESHWNPHSFYNKSSLNHLEYPFKKNFYQFA